jgi:hypothetical protein
VPRKAARRGRNGGTVRCALREPLPFSPPERPLPPEGQKGGWPWPPQQGSDPHGRRSPLIAASAVTSSAERIGHEPRVLSRLPVALFPDARDAALLLPTLWSAGANPERPARSVWPPAVHLRQRTGPAARSGCDGDADSRSATGSVMTDLHILIVRLSGNRRPAAGAIRAAGSPNPDDGPSPWGPRWSRPVIRAGRRGWRHRPSPFR